MKEIFDQSKYIQEYSKQHYERIAVSVPKGNKEILGALAKKKGMSMNALILTAIRGYYGIDLSRKDQSAI